MSVQKNGTNVESRVNQYPETPDEIERTTFPKSGKDDYRLSDHAERRLREKCRLMNVKMVKDILKTGRRGWKKHPEEGLCGRLTKEIGPNTFVILVSTERGRDGKFTIITMYPEGEEPR